MLSDTILAFTDQYLEIPIFVEGHQITLAQEQMTTRLYKPGEVAANALLVEFVSNRGKDYRSKRNFPSVEGTSKLSPYLASGVISARACLDYAMKANGGQLDKGNAGFVSWISELCWRDFYKHILVAFPHIGKSLPFKPHTDKLQWKSDDTLLQAWKDGNTGYPLVDAAMRQMNSIGWMHNRLRMVTAGFLCKDLLMDWRLGEKYFMKCLIDGDFSANNGGWQWSASTGLT